MAVTAEVTTTNSRPEFAPALQTIVALVRRIMNADVASILAFSLIDKTVRWKAASGFTVAVDYSQPVFRPLGSAIARCAIEQDTVGIIQGIGTRPELSTDDLPVHIAEGVRDLAVAPLRIIGNNTGALTAGYRRSHQFSEDEKRLLKDLAEMAAVVLDSERLVESITAAERIWEQTFNAIGEGILVHDSAGAILHCNARAAEMLETDQPAVIGLQFREAFARMFGRRAGAYYLEEIVRQALRCKEITRGLLDLTRQRQAKLALCDLSAIAKQCARAALQRAATNAEFEIRIDETIGEVATDAAMVNQILDNLF